ncbi:hypothetical protein TrRE_jg354, partial [Triparma retinervis]
MVRRGLPGDHISKCIELDNEVRADIAALISTKSDRSAIQKEVKVKKRDGEDVDEATIAKLKEMNVLLKGGDAQIEKKRKFLDSLLLK